MASTLSTRTRRPTIATWVERHLLAGVTGQAVRRLLPKEEWSNKGKGNL